MVEHTTACRTKQLAFERIESLAETEYDKDGESPTSPSAGARRAIRWIQNIAHEALGGRSFAKESYSMNQNAPPCEHPEPSCDCATVKIPPDRLLALLAVVKEAQELLKWMSDGKGEFCKCNLCEAKKSLRNILTHLDTLEGK